MTIAVSTVVKPSRILLAMSCGMYVGIIFIGWMVGSGQLGNLAFVYRIALAAVCLLMALAAFYYTVQTRKTHHIDISGIGQIRLGEYSALADSFFQADSSHGRDGGEVVNLMDDSTLWPFLLLLRLRSEDQRIKVLPILPDSVKDGEFRALSVAIRWIAAHNNSAEHRIL